MDKESGMSLADRSGALMMINKKERELLRTILLMTMRSSSAKEWITEKLGLEYVEIGADLIKSLGGDEL